jgi:hypothetical protein
VGDDPNRRQGTWAENVLAILVLIGLLVVLGFWILEPMNSAHLRSPQAALLQQGRQIGLAMFACSTDNTDHGNAYPDGASSTEVFQKLLDENYVTDPAIFYIPMPGKVKPVAGHKLKPENVSFDLTAGVVPGDSDGLPLVFSTGYRLNYSPGASAVPILAPFPQYLITRHSFMFMEGPPTAASPGIALMYKGNNAVWVQAPAMGAVLNVVPSTFDAKGKTYRQLTPDGVLPP